MTVKKAYLNKYILSFFYFFSLFPSLFAQNKNYIKFNVRDCINCVASTSYILDRDPQLSIVIPEKYMMDSSDLLENYKLEAYRRQIIWSTKLYDSLSSVDESELVQFRGKELVNRSGLKKLHFVYLNKTMPDSICLSPLSNQLVFRDYKDQMVLEKYLVSKYFVYFKKSKIFLPLVVDSLWIRRIYLDYLKDAKMYSIYKEDLKSQANIVPKIVSVMPLDEETIIATFRTYKINYTDNSYEGMYSFIKINDKGKSEVLFLDNELPKKHQFYTKAFFIHKNEIYASLYLSEEMVKLNKMDLEYLITLKKESNVYKFEKYLSATVNDYLIEKQLFLNFQTKFLSNGYFLTSLSNTIYDVRTGEKILIPFEDSIYKTIYISGLGPNFNIWDFKFNESEQAFYLLYSLNKAYYVASFPLGSQTFNMNEILYPFDKHFSDAIKNICLSWDGKELIYNWQNNNCLRYATFDEVRDIARILEAKHKESLIKK